MTYLKSITILHCLASIYLFFIIHILHFYQKSVCERLLGGVGEQDGAFSSCTTICSVSPETRGVGKITDIYKTVNKKNICVVAFLCLSHANTFFFKVRVCKTATKHSSTI